MGHVLILKSDLQWSKQTDVEGMNLLTYCGYIFMPHHSHTFLSWNDT